MTESSGLFKDYEDNFLLDEGKIRKILEVVNQYRQKLNFETYTEFYVGHKDNSYFETRDIAKVLGEDNTESRQIESFSISVLPTVEPENKSDGNKEVIYIGFTKIKPTRIRFFIKSDDRDWCYVLSEELDTQIKRILIPNPFKFIPLNLIDPLFIILIFFLFSLFSIWLVTKNYPHISLKEIEAMKPDERIKKTLEIISSRDYYGTMLGVPINFSAIFIFLIFIDYKPISRLVRFLYFSEFLIGDMAHKYSKFQDRLNKVYWGVAIGFVVSLSAGLFQYFIVQG